MEVPAACECLADDRFEGSCKHRVAVAIRKPVMAAATATSVAADGGVDEEFASQADADIEEADPDDCDCRDLPGAFPCWECVRTCQRGLPDPG